MVISPVCSPMVSYALFHASGFSLSASPIRTITPPFSQSIAEKAFVRVAKGAETLPFPFSSFPFVVHVKEDNYVWPKKYYGNVRIKDVKAEVLVGNDLKVDFVQVN